MISKVTGYIISGIIDQEEDKFKYLQSNYEGCNTNQVYDVLKEVFPLTQKIGWEKVWDEPANLNTITISIEYNRIMFFFEMGINEKFFRYRVCYKVEWENEEKVKNTSNRIAMLIEYGIRKEREGQFNLARIAMDTWDVNKIFKKLNEIFPNAKQVNSTEAFQKQPLLAGGTICIRIKHNDKTYYFDIGREQKWLVYKVNIKRKRESDFEEQPVRKKVRIEKEFLKNESTEEFFSDLQKFVNEGSGIDIELSEDDAKHFEKYFKI